MPLGLSAAKDGERKKSEGLLWQLKHDTGLAGENWVKLG